jgi:predicted RNase H-like nuclease (RuvC/YqgF family)
MKDMSEEKGCDVHFVEMIDVGNHGVENYVCPDCYHEAKDKIKSLESRLKEAEKNLEIERLGWKTIVEERDKRLSQAEAELRDNKSFGRGLAQACDSLRADNKSLEARLSHLMDVAGKMAKALDEIEDEDGLYKRHKLALAEWDGIKEGGK